MAISFKHLKGSTLIGSGIYKFKNISLVDQGHVHTYSTITYTCTGCGYPISNNKGTASPTDTTEWEDKFIVVGGLINDEEITTIQEQAFYDCSANCIIIPNTVTSIEDHAFHNVTGRIHLPNSLQYISEDAFSCSNSDQVSGLGMYTTTIYFHYSNTDEVLFNTNNLLPKGSATVGLRTYNIYTDNDIIKEACLDCADTLTTVNVYPLDNKDFVVAEFMLNEKVYWTERGMTWGEWVESDYNTANLSIVYSDSVQENDPIIVWREYNAEVIGNNIIDGLLDADDLQLASYDDLVTNYNLDLSTNYTTSSYSSLSPTKTTLKYIKEKNSELSSATKFIKSKQSEDINLGNYSFYNCSFLESVELSGVTDIGTYAFSGCTGLQTLNFVDKVKTIEKDAFDGLTGKIYLPNTLTSVTTPFSTTAGTYNLYFNYSDVDTVLFDTSTVLTAGTSKKTYTYNIYTDNTTLKTALAAYADSYTTVNVHHLDGTSWEE